MAAHEDITDSKYTPVDLTTAHTANPRGVDGPFGRDLCLVYVPADGVVYVQTGATDAGTSIATGGPLPTGVWNGVPCRVEDAPGNAGTGRPTLYFEGSADIVVRFVTSGIG